MPELICRPDGTLDWSATLDALKNDERYVEAINDYARKNLRGYPAICMRVFRKALEMALPLKRWRTAGWSNYWLGFLMLDRGEIDRALEHHLEALQKLEYAGDDFGSRRAKSAIAGDYRHLGLFDAALEWTIEALADAEAADDSPLRAGALTSLGELQMKLGQVDEAEKSLMRAESEKLTPQSRLQLVIAFAELRILEGKFSEAQDRANEALMLAEGGNNRQYLADALATRARSRHGLWRLDEAREDLEEAIRIGKELHDRRAIAEFLLLKGKIAATGGDYKLAFKTLRRSLIFAERTKSRGVQAAVHAEFSRIAKFRGKYKRAFEHFEEFHKLYESQYSERIERTLARLRSEIARRETRAYDRMYEKIGAIARIGQEISDADRLEDSLALIYEQVNQLMDASTFGIATYDDARGLLEYRIFVVDGRRMPDCPAVEIQDRDSFGGYAIRADEIVALNDIQNEYSRYIGSIEAANLDFDLAPIHSALYVPLKAKGRAVGLLTVQSHGKNAYDQRAVDALGMIGLFVAFALENGSIRREGPVAPLRDEGGSGRKTRPGKAGGKGKTTRSSAKPAKPASPGSSTPDDAKGRSAAVKSAGLKSAAGKKPAAR